VGSRYGQRTPVIQRSSGNRIDEQQRSRTGSQSAGPLQSGVAHSPLGRQLA